MAEALGRPTEQHPAGRQAWQVLRNADTRTAAMDVALNLADRLRDPQLVETAVLEAKLGRTADNPGTPWSPAGLAQGYAGLALLFGHLDRCFPDQDWDVTAHDYLELAAHDAAIRGHGSVSLFSGLSGLAFTASYLSRDGTRYQRLLGTLDRAIAARLAPMISSLGSRQTGLGVNAFDVISGLSGAGAYLVGRPASPALGDLVRCLVELSSVDDGMPRWRTPARLSSSADFMLRVFPEGYLNCGLAHGIPGPLATMSLAKLAGVPCPGLEQAISQTAAWLADHRLDDRWGANWPTGLGLRVSDEGTETIAPVTESPVAQAGWCYGSPGVARALYLAGLALEDATYTALAIEAVRAVVHRPSADRRIVSPTICHGIAGLLQIMLRFADDTGAEDVLVEAELLAEHLLGQYEPETLLGYRSVELEGRRVDQPGLLDGAPGVALALLAASCPVVPAWDRIFLLS